jgi:hypothetical protein
MVSCRRVLSHRRAACTPLTRRATSAPFELFSTPHLYAPRTRHGEGRHEGGRVPGAKGERAAAHNRARRSCISQGPGSRQWGEQTVSLLLRSALLSHLRRLAQGRELRRRGPLTEARPHCAGDCQQNQGQGPDEAAMVLPALRKGLPVLIRLSDRIRARHATGLATATCAGGSKQPRAPCLVRRASPL